MVLGAGRLARQGVAARTDCQPGFGLARCAVAVSANARRSLVPEERIELSTYPLPRGCATTTLLRRPRRAERPGAEAIAQPNAKGKGA